MAQALVAAMPQLTELGYNTTIVLEAIDPTTGNPVNGVVVSNVDIWADISDLGSGGGTVVSPTGPFMLVPGPNA